MSATIRYDQPNAVAHLATHTGTGWRSRCSTFWSGCEWDGGGLVTVSNWRGDGAGRRVILDWLNDLSIETALCKRCVARLASECDHVQAALARRGVG